MPTPLSVELTADITRLEAELKKAKARLNNFEAGVVKSGKGAGKGFQAVGKGAANAVPTLQEFSRVIQDAPFGIQGVGNNITQLVGNFNNLAKSTGGSRKAIKLLLSSMIGPAGILFAISAVVSLLTVFGDKLFTTGKKAQSLKDKIEGINKTFDLQLDKSKLLEENLKLQERSTIGILTARQNIYRTQIQSINALIDEQKEALKLQQSENNRLSGWEALTGLISEVTKKLSFQLGVTKFLDKALIKFVAAQTALLGIEAEKVKANAASAKDKQKEVDLSNALLELENRKLKAANDILKTEKAITEEKQKQGVLPASTGLDSVFQAGDVPLISGPSFAAIFANANTELSLFEKRLIDFQDASSQIINNGILDGFRALGDGIASALSGGENALQTFASGVFAALGNFLTQLGEAAILTGIGMLGIKKAFANPAAAIAAGAALVAAGALLSSAAASAPGGGVGNVSGQGSQSFSGSSTSSISRSNGFDGGEVVFKIQGRSLIGVLNRELKANNKTVGSVIG